MKKFNEQILVQLISKLNQKFDCDLIFQDVVSDIDFYAN